MNTNSSTSMGPRHGTLIVVEQLGKRQAGHSKKQTKRTNKRKD